MNTIQDFLDAALNGTIDDNENPLYAFSDLTTDMLLKMQSGEIDVHKLIDAQLAGRGMDKSGKWIGFTLAARVHKVQRTDTVMK